MVNLALLSFRNIAASFKMAYKYLTGDVLHGFDKYKVSTVIKSTGGGNVLLLLGNSIIEGSSFIPEAWSVDV